jgi:hypothetical protein
MSRNAKPRQRISLAELPAELTEARRFGKTRSARSGALFEDYVELIADLLAPAARPVAMWPAAWASPARPPSR